MPNKLAIVGGGPAGLSAAIYGATEGLETTLFEASGYFGGQSRASALVENLIGFPRGVSGAALAHKAVWQARRLGARLVPNSRIAGIVPSASGFTFDNGYTADAVILACGLAYRHIPMAPNGEVEYGKGTARVHAKGHNIVVIGGANSAGQAALALAQHGAKRVDLVVRSKDMSSEMSAYLLERVTQCETIFIHTEASVKTIVHGAVTLNTGETLEEERVFAYIGSAPDAGQMPCDRDEHGYIVAKDGFETSTSGLYVVGDIRSNSTHRIATAIGEGAAAVEQAMRHLGEQK